MTTKPGCLSSLPLVNSKETILIDEDDFDRFVNHKWFLIGRGYAYSSEMGYLHRNLIKPEEGLEVDHINRNKLDNRKSNLRVVTKSQNQWNKNRYLNNTSGFVGVDFNKSHNKWRARIAAFGKRITIGYFNNIEEAGRAYQLAKETYHA